MATRYTIATLEKAQTFSNKTHTSPLFQGSIDGWVLANESWTYASANTITVPSGAASKYQKGDRIKFTQTTVKYGVITAVADTLLTIAVNTDYVVANAAITANYYSHEANPIGYPTYFNVTPTVTNATGATGNLSKVFAKFAVLGKSITFVGSYSSGTIGGTITGPSYSFSMPITSYNSSFGSHVGVAHIRQASTRFSGYCTPNAGTTLIVRGYNEPSLSNVTVEVSFSITYEMD